MSAFDPKQTFTATRLSFRYAPKADGPDSRRHTGKRNVRNWRKAALAGEAFTLISSRSLCAAKPYLHRDH
jgi:hypothetical protein